MPGISDQQIFSRIVNEDGQLKEPFFTWVGQVTALDPLTGEGPPEGNVKAAQFRHYIDTNGTASNVEYVKLKADITGDTSLGWVLI